MLHHIYGRKFSRPTAHRTSIFKNLVRGLVISGKITTTKQKAKAMVGLVDRMVREVKKDRVGGSREAVKILGDRKLVNKFVNEIVPLFQSRAGGVTRIVPLRIRASDTAEMVRLEWVVEIPTSQKMVKPAEVTRATRVLRAPRVRPQEKAGKRPEKVKRPVVRKAAKKVGTK